MRKILSLVIILCICIFSSQAVSGNDVEGGKGEDLFLRAQQLQKNTPSDHQAIALAYLGAIKANPDNLLFLKSYFEWRRLQDIPGIQAIANDLKPLAKLYPDAEALQLMYGITSILLQNEDAAVSYRKMWQMASSQNLLIQELAIKNLIFLAQSTKNDSDMQKIISFVNNDDKLRNNPSLLIEIIGYYRQKKDREKFFKGVSQLLATPELYNPSMEYSEIFKLLNFPGGLKLCEEFVKKCETSQFGISMPPDFYIAATAFALNGTFAFDDTTVEYLRHLIERVTQVNDLRREYMSAVVGTIAAYLVKHRDNMPILPRLTLVKIMIEGLKVIVEDSPDDSTNAVSLVELYCDIDELENAEKNLEELPCFTAAQRIALMTRLVANYNRHDNPAKARQIMDWLEKKLKEMNASKEDMFAFYHACGFLTSSANDNKSALLYFENAYKLKPDDATNTNNLAYTLSLLKKELPRAKELSISALKAADGPAFMYDTLAWIHYQLGEYDDAMTAMNKCLAARIQELNKNNATMAQWEMEAEMKEHLQAILRAVKLERLGKAYEF